MNNPSFKDCWHGLCLRLAVLILTGLGAVILPLTASAQSETRIISVNTNLDFGKVEIGGQSDFLVTIANRGNADLTISNINLPDGFSTLAPLGAFGGFGYIDGFTNVTIPAGGRTNFLVIFVPTNVMHYGGTATIDSDATSGKNTFIVSGDGAFPTGQYIGLFSPATDATFESSGYFSVNLAANGGFSGVLRLAGVRTPFSGRLSSSGTYSGSIPQKDGSALGVSFQIHPGLWQGVINNETWSADLIAYRVFPTSGAIEIEAFRMPASPQSLRPRPRAEAAPRKYHFQIAGSTNSLLAPTNNGAGTMEFRTSQPVRLRGTLGDGTVFSENTWMLGGHQLPLYVPLYHNQGAVLGWIDFEFVPTNFPVPAIVPVGTIVLTTNGTTIDSFTNFFPTTNFPPYTNIIVPISNIFITNFPPITNIVFTNFPRFTNFPPVTNIVVIPWVPPALPPLLPPDSNIVGLTAERRGVLAPGLPPPFAGTNRISGSINWFKPAQLDPNYPDGISIQTTVNGPTE